ncbi:MAG: hypothetical protein ACI959_001845 [Limisphaerales bacterium]|jgi:hypothetical protein
MKETKQIRISKYAAMAGAFLGTAAAAEAAIVYTDVDPDTVVDNSVFLIDMNADGITDFQVGQSGSSSTTYGTFAFNFASLSGNPSVNYGFVNPGGSYYSSLQAAAMSAGESIGPAAPITTNTWATMAFGSSFSGYAYGYGEWNNVTDKYLGVSFDIAGATHYGWIRCDAAIGVASITVKGFAYEDVAGMALSAGDVGACSTATPPLNPIHVDGIAGASLSWDAVAGTVACQVKGTRLVPPGPSPSVNILGAEPTTVNVPYAAAGAGTTWEWSVRCACSTSPVAATGFSATDTFVVPDAGRITDLVDATVYPNPADERTMVQLGQSFTHDMEIRITDLAGRVVDWVKLPAEARNIELDVAHMENGVYFVQIGNMDAITIQVSH